MRTKTYEIKSVGCVIIFYIVMILSWIINLVKLLNCDFDAPFKEEIIYAIGLLAPPTSIVTVWF